MGIYPLVADEIDAGADLVRRVHERSPLLAAFWLRPEPEDRLRFYLVPDAAKGAGRNELFEALHHAQNEAPSPYLDLDYLKVVSPDNPFAQAAAYLLGRFRLAKPLHLRGRAFGNSTVDEFCLYPLPAPAAAPGPTA